MKINVDLAGTATVALLDFHDHVIALIKRVCLTMPSRAIASFSYVPTGVVWVSIVRPSAPSVIGTLRGFADSATGMRSVSTPVS